jgi:serine/threonine protein kinase
MYDPCSLYPKVHDLDEDPSSPRHVAWCSFFDLQSLLIPSESNEASHPSSSICADPACTDSPRNVVDRVDSTASELFAEHKYAPVMPERFQDAYVLTRQIYQGHSSMVWESINRRTGLRYATKIVDRRAISSMEDARVVREVALLKSLDSNRGTISCIDFYQEQHHYYIISEYAEGGSLEQRLLEKRRLPEAQVKELAKSLLRALQYLHSHDICHRNLRPDNILIHLLDNDTEEGLIADFSTAIHLPYFGGARGQITGRCGSSLYAAPEVQNRSPYDTKCDMWSLGVVLFLALSGSLPFLDKSRRSLHRKIQKAEYTFDPKDWSTVSRDARRFISKLLRANPDERITAERALRDVWLCPPVLPAIAEDIPIEQTLSDTISVVKKVRFDDLPKSSKRKNKLQRVFTHMLSRKSKEDKSEDDGSTSSHTISTTSSDQGNGMHFGADVAG